MSERRRPDPDELLLAAREEEARRSQGRLRLFLGAAPGVGKTYGMLEAAQVLRRQGLDVVIGWVDTHHRADTEALLEGLEILPRRKISYHGVEIEELDLDAAIERRPKVLVVDELAHTNAPGSRHSKRYRDVEELLAAGIDVWTAVNVQHLESLNDVVAQVTGVVVRETVPDAILERADDVTLVDLAPEELQKRLAEGKVYVPEMAAAAAASFFRLGNLIALRELALRRTAAQVDAQMQRYRREHAISQVWPTAERLLVCVGPSPYAAQLVRATRRLAERAQARWLAVHVQAATESQLPEADRAQLARNLTLAEQLGGEVVSLAGDSVAEELIELARRRNVATIVVGRGRTGGRRHRGVGLVEALLHAASGINVLVIGTPVEPRRRQWSGEIPRASAAGYFWALGVVLVSSVVAGLARSVLGLPNLAMLYLLGVVVVAIRFGPGPSAMCSVISVAAFDFLFVPPPLTFSVADTQYLVTFAVMLIVALVISNLGGRLHQQVETSRERERRTATLYALSRSLAAATDEDQVLEATVRQVGELFASGVAIFLPRASGGLVARTTDAGAGTLAHDEVPVAQWVFDHREPAGAGTDTLPGSRGLFLPLLTPRGAVGVLAVRAPVSGRPVAPEQLHLLETLANQCAMALERVSLARGAAEARVEVEAEKLRSSLLSSVSHDLRTPLTAIAGAAAALVDMPEEDRARRSELAQMVATESDRLNRLVGNLLQVTRLESGAISLEREPQPIEEAVGAALVRAGELLGDRAVRVELPDDLPLVEADGLLLEQLLFNLVENAVKHTPEGADIEITAWREDAWLVVEVADHGPGVAPEEAGKVFDKFYRGRSVGSAPGAGLGLTICRGIVVAHGGAIWAQNRSDGGLAVRFRLPAMAPSAGPPPEGADAE